LSIATENENFKPKKIRKKNNKENIGIIKETVKSPILSVNVIKNKTPFSEVGNSVVNRRQSLKDKTPSLKNPVVLESVASPIFLSRTQKNVKTCTPFAIKNNSSTPITVSGLPIQASDSFLDIQSPIIRTRRVVPKNDPVKRVIEKKFEKPNTSSQTSNNVENGNVKSNKDESVTIPNKINIESKQNVNSSAVKSTRNTIGLRSSKRIKLKVAPAPTEKVLAPESKVTRPKRKATTAAKANSVVERKARARKFFKSDKNNTIVDNFVIAPTPESKRLETVPNNQKQELLTKKPKTLKSRLLTKKNITKATNKKAKNSNGHSHKKDIAKSSQCNTTLNGPSPNVSENVISSVQQVPRLSKREQLTKALREGKLKGINNTATIKNPDTNHVKPKRKNDTKRNYLQKDSSDSSIKKIKLIESKATKDKKVTESPLLRDSKKLPIWTNAIKSADKKKVFRTRESILNAYEISTDPSETPSKVKKHKMKPKKVPNPKVKKNIKYKKYTILTTGPNCSNVLSYTRKKSNVEMFYGNTRVPSFTFNCNSDDENCDTLDLLPPPPPPPSPPAKTTDDENCDTLDLLPPPPPPSPPPKTTDDSLQKSTDSIFQPPSNFTKSFNSSVESDNSTPDSFKVTSKRFLGTSTPFQVNQKSSKNTIETSTPFQANQKSSKNTIDTFTSFQANQKSNTNTIKTSTPAFSNKGIEIPAIPPRKTIEEDIQDCFGFEEDEEGEDEVERVLNLPLMKNIQCMMRANTNQCSDINSSHILSPKLSSTKRSVNISSITPLPPPITLPTKKNHLKRAVAKSKLPIAAFDASTLFIDETLEQLQENSNEKDEAKSHTNNQSNGSNNSQLLPESPEKSFVQVNINLF